MIPHVVMWVRLKGVLRVWDKVMSQSSDDIVTLSRKFVGAILMLNRYIDRFEVPPWELVILDSSFKYRMLEIIL